LAVYLLDHINIVCHIIIYLVLKKSSKFKDFEWILKIRSDYQNLMKIILQFAIIDSLNLAKPNN
jgi:hypothetical protein